jgi:hypothetical protein
MRRAGRAARRRRLPFDLGPRPEHTLRPNPGVIAPFRPGSKFTSEQFQRIDGAILDRLFCAHRLTLKVESLRRAGKTPKTQRAVQTAAEACECLAKGCALEARRGEIRHIATPLPGIHIP